MRRGLVAKEVQVEMHSAALGGSFSHELPKILAAKLSFDPRHSSNELVVLSQLSERLLASDGRIVRVRNSGCKACVIFEIRHQRYGSCAGEPATYMSSEMARGFGALNASNLQFSIPGRCNDGFKQFLVVWRTHKHLGNELAGSWTRCAQRGF